MISNKTNNAVIHEILEVFAKKGVDQLKGSLERLFDQLMVADARRLHRSRSLQQKGFQILRLRNAFSVKSEIFFSDFTEKVLHNLT